MQIKKTFSLKEAIVFSIILSVTLINFFSYYRDMKGKTEENIEFQKKKIEDTLFNIELKLSDENDVIDAISGGVGFSFYDFFVIKKNHKIIASSPESKLPNLESVPVNAEHFLVQTGNLKSYISKKLYTPYEFTLGYYDTHIEVFTPESIKNILIDNIFDILILSLVFIYITLKDHLKIIKLIRQGKGKEINEIKSSITDLQIFKDLYIYSNELTRKHLDYTIPDAVENELALGSKESDNFMGSLFRIDLNSYTKLSTTYGNLIIDELLKPILIEFKDIAQRYKHYEILDEGDGRGYFHKSYDKEYSSKLTASTIRGMFEISKKYNKHIQAKIGEDFIFKAGISFDEARLTKEEQKFMIRGSAFYNSARTIGIFKDEKLQKKKKYYISAISKYFSFPNNLINSYEIIKLNLDGIGNEELIIFDQFKTEPERIEDLEFYLSNEDLKKTLNKLINKFDIEFFWAFQKSIKDLKIYIFDLEHTNQIFSLLELYKTLNPPDEVIAATLMMIIKFVEPGSLNQEKIKILNQYLKSNNPRIISNTMEVLNYLNVFTIEAISFLNHENNRIRANAQVILGKNQLSSELNSSIHSLLNSTENENYLLSGIYALDELFSFYLNSNFTIFKTADFFKQFMSEVKSFDKIENIKIKDRVLTFISKYEMYFK